MRVFGVTARIMASTSVVWFFSAATTALAPFEAMAIG